MKTLIKIVPIFFLSCLFGNPQKTEDAIKTYIESRIKLNENENYFKDRNDLRSAYLKTDLTLEKTVPLITSYAQESVKNELNHRFQEWDKKIQLGKLTKEETTINQEQFKAILDTFVKNYSSLIDSEAFKSLNESRKNLRNLIVEELKTSSPDDVIKKYSIENKELQNRIKDEWSWKVNQ